MFLLKIRQWIFAVVMITVVCIGAEENKDRNSPIVLQNGQVKLVVDSHDFSLVQISDLRQNIDYVKEPGSSLFEIALWNPQNPTTEQNPPTWYSTRPGTMIMGNMADKYIFTYQKDSEKQILHLKYIQIPVRQKENMVDVEVTITLPNHSSLFEWHLSMTNSSDLQLYEVHFPSLSGLASSKPGSEKTDYIAAPVYSGVKMKSPRTTKGASQGLNEYPGAGSSIQMLSYCDDFGGGLYLASYDSKGYRKTFDSRPTASKKAFKWFIIHYADLPAYQKWQLPYPIICGPIQGDWYDAAKIYRKQFASKNWTPLYKRTDIAPWFRDLSVWFQGQDRIRDDTKPMAAFTDHLIKLREMLCEDYGFHWYLWQKYYKHDYRYPNYFPSQIGFKEAIRHVQKAGVHVMPYTNIHLFDQNMPMWKQAKGDTMAVRELDGKITKGGSCGTMAPMCMSVTKWRNIIINIERKLVRCYNVDGIYFDELYCYPNFCYSANHNHPCFGGTYFTAGMRDVLRRVKELKAWKKKKPVIMGEQMGETYMKNCNALLNGHADQKMDSIPIFQAVNADNTTEVGMFLNSAEVGSHNTFMSSIGFNLVRGRQLGWFNFDQFDITKPEYSWQLAKLREFCSVRRAGQEFLFFGEFLRTPDLSSLSTTTRVVQLWITGFKNKQKYEVPVVLAECYRSPQGSIGIVLTNHTAQDQNISIPWNAKDWGISVGTKIKRQDYKKGQWDKSTSFTLADKLIIMVPAYSPMLVKISLQK